MEWRSLARLVEYGLVEMAISIAVGMFADIHNSLLMTDFCGPDKSACLFVCFPSLYSRRTAVLIYVHADSVLGRETA